jgi:hypothetical protein
VSLAVVEEKLADLQQMARRGSVNLGMPNYTDAAGRMSL